MAKSFSRHFKQAKLQPLKEIVLLIHQIRAKRVLGAHGARSTLQVFRPTKFWYSRLHLSLFYTSRLVAFVSFSNILDLPSLSSLVIVALASNTLFRRTFCVVNSPNPRYPGDLTRHPPTCIPHTSLLHPSQASRPNATKKYRGYTPSSRGFRPLL